MQGFGCRILGLSFRIWGRGITVVSRASVSALLYIHDLEDLGMSPLR